MYLHCTKVKMKVRLLKMRDIYGSFRPCKQKAASGMVMCSTLVCIAPIHCLMNDGLMWLSDVQSGADGHGEERCCQCCEVRC